jgi:hypothetical protein
MAEVKKNVTTIFIVPTLNIGKERLKENGFLSGYYKDELKDVHYDDCTYLLFKPSNVDMFKEFVDTEYARTDKIVDEYDYEGGYVVLVYQLDKKFKPDFDLVREGRYSKTSSEFQLLFPKVIKIVKNGLRRDEVSLHYRVFNKSEDIRKYWEDRIGSPLPLDIEVWEGFIEENETLNIEKFKLLYV